MYDERVSVSMHRVPVIPAELVLAYVHVSARVKKSVTDSMVSVAWMQELNLWSVLVVEY